MLYEHTRRQSLESPQTSPNKSLRSESADLNLTMLAPSLRKAIEDSSEIHPDLQAVMIAWPHLPEAIRMGIIAMVKSFQ